jgi:hypothetical protein
MSRTGFIGVISCMKRMATGCMSMMGRFLVVPTIVMLGCFAVMVSSMGMMFCGFPMVIGCFLRHKVKLPVRG